MNQIQKLTRGLALGIAACGLLLCANVMVSPEAKGQAVSAVANPRIAVRNTDTATAITPGASLWTNKIVASTAFTNWTKINLEGFRTSVTLELLARADAANSGACTVSLGANNNGGVGGAINGLSTNVMGVGIFTATLNGTAQVVGLTNINLANFGPQNLYIIGVSNAGASGDLTNYSLRVFGR